MKSQAGRPATRTVSPHHQEVKPVAFDLFRKLFSSLAPIKIWLPLGFTSWAPTYGGEILSKGWGLGPR